MQAVEGRRRQMIDFRSGLQRLAPCAIPSLYSFVSPTQDTKISRMADILKTAGAEWIYEEHVEGFKYEG